MGRRMQEEGNVEFSRDLNESRVFKAHGDALGLRMVIQPRAVSSLGDLSAGRSCPVHPGVVIGVWVELGARGFPLMQWVGVKCRQEACRDSGFGIAVSSC